MPEIQDEQHSKRTLSPSARQRWTARQNGPSIEGPEGPSPTAMPPPTAQMPGSNLLIFWREAPQWDLLRGIGAIFEFRSMSGDMGVQSPNSRPFSDPRLELILLL